MKKLLFGTAGIPWCAKGEGAIGGIRAVKELGLESMELEFVHSINVKENKTAEIKQAAEKNGITLTCHGQYFVNLNSSDKKVLEASIKRILDASRIASMCGCWSICYHMAYYSKSPHDEVVKKIKDQLSRLLATLKKEGHDIWVRPETGGKINQFADSYDLIKMSAEMENVLPCFDFAHQYSRTLSKWNTKDEFHKLLSAIEKYLGRKGLDNMHIHMEGIEFTDKGEKNHLNLDECNFNYKDLMKVWKEFNIKGIVTCESPNIEKDALHLQKIYKQL